MGKKIRKNKNGNMEVEEWIKMIHNNELDAFMRKHQVTKDPCPPYELIPLDTVCTYCTECQRQAAKEVKEFKNYYKVGKKKYKKEDLNGR